MKADNLYEIKQKISMSQKIVKKDKTYGLFSGADLTTSLTIAKLKTALELNLIKESILTKTALTLLDYKRKAYFSSTCTELTKLGFILGDPRTTISATE
ncbi:MAG TPA: hypothetical protein VKA34_03160 [Balneolales bacterium]|nr:hypothetical protein [Balneolales bacterium]